jgi:lipopolysaccharide transport system permease protein
MGLIRLPRRFILQPPNRAVWLENTSLSGDGLLAEVQGGAQVAQYFSKIWQLRYFWMALVRIDLKNRYRRSLIGVGWSLLHPILMTVVLCTVFVTLFKQEVKTYAPFLLCGLIFWNFVTTAMSQGCHCFFAGESYIRQHPAPLAIYPLRTVLGGAIHFLLGLAVVLVFVWCVNGFGNLPALVGLVPSLLLIFILGWSLAILMGVLNVLFQDCQHLTEVLLQVLFYVTPIMYPASVLRARHLDWFVNLNPLAVMLDLLRDPVLFGTLPSPQSYAWGIAAAALAALTAALTLARFEKRMIFYL